MVSRYSAFLSAVDASSILDSLLTKAIFRKLGRATSREGFVSKRWTGAAVLTVSLSVVWLVFILLGSPWTGLMWVVSLAFAAAVWASRRAAQSSRSIGQVIAALESEPVPVATIPATKAVH